MIGHETATAYHPFLGQPTSVTDVANNQVKATMVYDALGRVVSVTDAFDLTTSQAYALTTAGASDWTKTQTVSDSSGFNGVAGSWTNGTYPVTAVSVSSVYAVRTTAAAKPAVT
ncbi:MAG TPA: hypothetical protein VHN79_08955, partial [Lacunisphaera sp.]|nr:hypothetical protein [Lacunisphaera sp.]